MEEKGGYERSKVKRSEWAGFRYLTRTRNQTNMPAGFSLKWSLLEIAANELRSGRHIGIVWAILVRFSERLACCLGIEEQFMAGAVELPYGFAYICCQEMNNIDPFCGDDDEYL